RVLTFLYSKMNGIVPKPGELDERDEEILSSRIKFAGEVEKRIEGCEFKAGLKTILRLAQEGNRYLNETAPWANPEKADTALYVLVQVVHALAVISAPYLPFTSQRILDYLNLDKRVEDLRWSDVKKLIPSGHRINKPKPLFRKISREEIDEKLRKLESIKIQKKVGD
ncbi:MAG: methionine--tRNA ligase, partial [Thaumarchaeota archaeon]